MDKRTTSKLLIPRDCRICRCSPVDTRRETAAGVLRRTVDNPRSSRPRLRIQSTCQASGTDHSWPERSGSIRLFVGSSRAANFLAHQRRRSVPILVWHSVAATHLARCVTREQRKCFECSLNCNCVFSRCDCAVGAAPRSISKCIGLVLLFERHQTLRVCMRAMDRLCRSAFLLRLLMLFVIDGCSAYDMDWC